MGKAVNLSRAVLLRARGVLMTRQPLLLALSTPFQSELPVNSRLVTMRSF